MLLLPFASYLIAEHIGVSGILAAVAAGMTISKSGVIRNAPLAMRLRADNVWGMLEFVFNGLVFIMLGLQLPGIWQVSVIEAELDPTVETWMLFTAVIVIYFALLVLRFCWLWMMKTVSRLTLKRKPLDFTFYTTRELWLASFAGARGDNPGRCALYPAVPAGRHTVPGALSDGVYRRQGDYLLALYGSGIAAVPAQRDACRG